MQTPVFLSKGLPLYDCSIRFLCFCNYLICVYIRRWRFRFGPRFRFGLRLTKHVRIGSTFGTCNLLNLETKNVLTVYNNPQGVTYSFPFWCRDQDQIKQKL